MKFVNLLDIVGDEAIFESSLLLAGQVNSADVRRQLSLWVAGGKLYQLPGGLRPGSPTPFLVLSGA